MKRIRIKNFGPITQGYKRADGWFDIKKVTFFCGPQGSGKSTIAKLISSFLWIEKALLRGDFTEKELNYSFLRNERFKYLGIDNYFLLENGTEIEFESDVYSFRCISKKITVKSNLGKQYIRPKIMYIPAERNLLSTVNDKILDNMKGLPQTLYTLLAEYNKTKKSIGSSKQQLPLEDVFFYYDEKSDTSFITNKAQTYKLPVSESASGYQSLIPMTLVSHYLAEEENYLNGSSVQPLTYNIEQRMKSGLNKMNVPDVVLHFSSGDVSLELKAVLDTSGIPYAITEKASNRKVAYNQIENNLLNYLSRFYNQCFVNIVEEPEQNLYPASQRLILYDLLSCNNKKKNNMLVLTTHSPYMLYYITLAIKAGQLLAKGVPYNKIKSIIPENAIVHGSDVVIYELNEKGFINKLSSYKDMPSDTNILNNEISKGNDDFDKMLYLEKNAG
ncbi:MAG: ATP-binding protein [Spirochaetaceae bacterium]|jgi:energy-coupling factor transporter ATP-binding protein EcfA2|nr:ATP-binding protein [Spirochaetaceae bacterium]